MLETLWWRLAAAVYEFDDERVTWKPCRWRWLVHFSNSAGYGTTSFNIRHPRGYQIFCYEGLLPRKEAKCNRGPHPYKISSLPASDKGTRLRNAFGRQHSAKQGRKSSTIAPNGLGIYHDDPSKCSNAVQFDDNFIIIKDLSLKATVCLLIFPTLAPPGCLM